MARTRTMCAWIAAVLILGAASWSQQRVGVAEPGDAGLHLVAGTLSKLDLRSGTGILTTDLGQPVYFEVAKAYLFENVTVGARITVRLDREGQAVRVMDTSIPDVVPLGHSISESSETPADSREEIAP